MLKMVDGTGIIGVDMICPLGVSTPQPPNYDKVEMEGAGILVLPNSLNAPLERLELGGKTEQVQTTGANLFDEKLLLDFDSENYDKTQSGSGFYYYKFPVNGTVTASTKNANKNGEYLTVGIKPDGSDKTWLSHGSAAISKYKTLTPEDGNIYLGVNNSLERVKSMIQNTGGIIINEGSAAKPYEPYTGGKPSPSPEYPQEIKSVGKWNDEKQKYEVDVKVSNCGYLQKGSYADKIRPLPLEKGKTYRIYVDVKSAVVNVGILNEERTFANSGQLYAYYNSRGYPISSTGVVSGICRLPNSLYRGYTFTVTVDGLFLYQGVNANILNTDNAYVAYDFIKKVDISSPYTEKESVVLTSDRPITKWDRLVEQGGQIGWLYGSVIATIDETASISLYAPNGFYVYVKNIDKKEKTGYCDKLYAKKMSNGEPFVLFGNANNNGLYTLNTQEFYGKTVSEIKEKLKEYPLNIIGKSETTEFVPLPQSEQNAIRALKAYYPTTVITADGGELDPDIKVTYRKEI